MRLCGVQEWHKSLARSFCGALALAIVLGGTTAALGTERPAESEAALSEEEHGQMLDEITLIVATDEPVAIVRPSEPERARLVVRNPYEHPVTGTLELGVRDRSSDPVALTSERAIAVDAGGEQELPLPAELLTSLGVKYVDWRITTEDGRTTTRHTSFAHMEPVGVTAQIQRGAMDGGDEFLFGIAGGMRAYLDSEFKDRFLNAAAIIGTEAYRVDMSWNRLQPDPDTWEWEGLDELVNLAEHYGMFIQPLVAYGNPWAVSEQTRRLAEEEGRLDHLWRYPPKLEPWAAFNRKLAERYGTQMQYYEIWNEPDIGFFYGTAEQYVELLEVSYREIKSVNPDIIVTTGGMTSLSHPRLDRELQELTFTRGATSFDAVAWHRHGDFHHFQDEVDNQLLPMLREHGLADRPLVFNETAVGRPFEREHELATQLVKKLTFTWSRGAFGYYWFNLLRSHPAMTMLNEDWTPRPSYPAYNELARLLRGRKHAHDLDLGDGRWGFVFHGQGHFTGQGDGDWVIVSWTEQSDLPDETFLFNVSPTAEAWRVDLMGNREAAKAVDGVVSLRVSTEPSYLVIEGSDTPPADPQTILRMQDVPALVPGRPETLRVMVRNPFAEPARLRLDAVAAEPLTVRAVGLGEQALEPGSATEAEVELLLDAAPPGESTVLLALTLRDAAGEPFAHVDVPVVVITPVPSGAMRERPADFVLDDSSDIVNENDADPSRSHLTWQGPADLSVQAWLAREGNDLQLRFEVRDDIHRQPHAGEDLWRGDSVQVGMQLPGQDGHWEIGLARSDDGDPLVHAWRSPAGIDAAAVETITLRTQRDDDVTIYEATLPGDVFGFDAEALGRGIGFSFVVNDLDDPDETEREGYARLTPGIAGSKAPELFRRVVFE